MLTARRAERSDKAGVEALIGRNVLPFIKRFGQFSLAYLIESSSLAVTVEDEEENIVGFASFENAPPAGLQVDELMQDKCYEWFAKTFRNEMFGAENTAWLTFFVAEDTVEGDAADRLLQTVFSTLPYLEGVLAVVPSDVQAFTPVSEMFEQMPLVEPSYYGPQVYGCPRSFFIPPLKIRRAVIEDHDDLVPVFNEQSEVLTDIYGEFFLADLIETKEPNSQSLVAEINGRAVGLMTITDDIDVALLRHTFDLTPYDDLYVVEDEEEEKEEEEEEKPEVLVEEVHATPEARAGSLFLRVTTSQGVATVSVENFKSLMQGYASSLGADEENADFELTEPVNQCVADFVASLTASGEEEKKEEEKEEESKKGDAKKKEGAKGAKKEVTTATEEKKENTEEEAEGEGEGDTHTHTEEEADGEGEAPETQDPNELNSDKFTEGVLKVAAVTETAMFGVLEYLEATVPQLEAQEDEDKEAEEPEPEEVEEVPKIDNCFAITLFCLDEGFEARSLAFLEPAFDLFPEKEYCVITLPTTAQEPHLLSHFTQVPPLPTSTLGHVMYLLHRDSVSENEVSLKWITPGDLEAVCMLYEGAPNAAAIEATLNESIKSRKNAEAEAVLQKREGKTTDNVNQLSAYLTDQAAFVVECFGQQVGVICLENRTDVELLRSSYAVEEFVELNELYNNNDTSPLSIEERRKSQPLACVLKYFVVNPLFYNKKAFLFREIMRMYYKSIVYYEVRPGEALQDVTRLFVQVRPRKQPEQPPNLTTLIEGDNGGKPKSYLPYYPDEGDFALHVLTKRLLSQPKAMLNARVVIVGASVVAISFLEQLLLQSDLNYSNITLVSKYGLQRGRSMNKSDCQFQPWGLTYDEATMQRLSLQSRVRVIADTLADIECDQKHIVLSDGSILPYDHLVLSPGLQDQTAGVLGIDLNTNHGLFSITDEEDIRDMQAFLDEASPQRVVVYGNTLQALTALRGLLDSSVAPSWITWAFPNNADSPLWCANDQEVNQRVCTELVRLGVKILPHTQLLDVTHDELGMISSATLKQTTVTIDDNKVTKKVEFPCQMLVGCHSPDVDAAIFTAITENSLVYDGRLVVSSTFATADPSVFAAGTIAKFSRKYGSSLPQERYNSREVGQRLAESILTAMDPVVVDTEKDEAMHSTLPTLGVLPKILEASLPGGLRYFSAIKPSLIAPKKPKVLVSDEKDNLVRLVFDDLDILVSITYIGSSKNVHCKNLSKMVGFPSNYLNRILWRYEKKLIPDLLAFLSAPWATALGHEAFPELCEQITEGVVEKENQMSEILETYLTHIQSRTKQSSSAVSDMVEDLLPDDIKRHIQVKMLQFLNLHANHLPGYQITAEKPPPTPEKVTSV